MGAPSCGNMPYQARFAGGRVFDREQHGASPLAAKARCPARSGKSASSSGAITPIEL